MGSIHDDPDLVHLLDHANPEAAESPVGLLVAPVPDHVSVVVGEQDVADPQPPVDLEHVEIPGKRVGALEVEAHCELSIPPGANDVVDAIDQYESVRISQEEVAAAGDRLDRGEYAGLEVGCHGEGAAGDASLEVLIYLLLEVLGRRSQSATGADGDGHVHDDRVAERSLGYRRTRRHLMLLPGGGPNPFCVSAQIGKL